MQEIENGIGHQVSKTYRAMGTRIDLTLFGVKETRFLDEAYQLILDYEALFTVNRADSELMKINQMAGIKPVQVPLVVYRLCQRALEESMKADGFNALIGPVVKLWHIGFSDAKRPVSTDIAKKRALIDPQDVVINDRNLSVFLKKKGMELDLGAIAKGFIADKIQLFWQAKGLESGIINLGGNLLLMGNAPIHADGLWRVGIRNPLQKTTRSILQVLTPAQSFVTSGISERFLDVEGKRYHHILDSRTGYPHENDIASVTVLTPRSVDGEVESTRLFFADGNGNHTQNPAIIVRKDFTIELLHLDEKRVHLSDARFSLLKSS